MPSRAVKARLTWRPGHPTVPPVGTNVCPIADTFSKSQGTAASQQVLCGVDCNTVQPGRHTGFTSIMGLSTQSLMCVASSWGVMLASLAGSGNAAYSILCSTLVVGVGGVLSIKTVRLLPCKVTSALLGKNA